MRYITSECFGDMAFGICEAPLLLTFHDYVTYRDIPFLFLHREWLFHRHIRIVFSCLIHQWTLPHARASVVRVRLQLQFGWWRRTKWPFWFWILRKNWNRSTTPAVQDKWEEDSVILVDSRCRYSSDAAQSVIVTRSSVITTCSWGIKDCNILHEMYLPC
jgi:hypothetical protein